MAKTFYGYAERKAENFVNWAEIGKDITQMLKDEVKVREDKKTAIDKATRAYEETLANAPQGEYTDFNEYISNFASDATQAMLIQERLLKTGQLKVKDYVLARDNLISGTNQMFAVAKEYQAAFENAMKRARAGESQYTEQWEMRQVEGLANFKNTRAFIDPTTYKVSIGKMVKNIEDVYEMSSNPNDFMTVNELRNRLQGQLDKYNLKEGIDEAVSSLGVLEEVVKDYAAREGGLDLILKKTDAKKGEYALPGDEKVIGGYKKWEDDRVKMIMANKIDLQSLVTDFSIRSKDGGQIEPTRDKEVFDNDTTGKYFFLDTSTGSRQGIPVFKQETLDQVEVFLRSQIRAGIDQKVDVTASRRPILSASNRIFNLKQTQATNAVQNIMQDWIQFADSASTQELVDAANQNIAGRKIQDKQGRELLRVDKTQDGIELVWKSKMGPLERLPVPITDKDSYIRAVIPLLPKELQETFSLEQLRDLGYGLWRGDSFNKHSSTAGRKVNTNINNIPYDVDAKTFEVKTTVSEAYRNEKNEIGNVIDIASKQLQGYNQGRRSQGLDDFNLTLGTADDRYVLSNPTNNARLDLKHARNGEAKAFSELKEMIYNVNMGTTNSDSILAGAVDAFLEDYKKELVRGGVPETVVPVIYLNGKGYSISDFADLKGDNFELLVQTIKSLGDGNFGSEEKIKRGAVSVQQTGGNIRK